MSRSPESASLRSISRSIATVVSVSLGAISGLGFAAAGAIAQTAPGAAAPSGTVASTTVPTTDVILPTGSAGGATLPSGTSNPSATIPTTGGIPLSAVRFTCRQNNGQYTVMYQPESQPGKYFAWAVPQQMGGGWSPERRCQEISSRLERYRPEGLVEMQTGTENGYNTVCVTTDSNGSCRIVFTVPRGQDPATTRDRVFQNLAVADTGQQTAGVFTYQQGHDRQLLDQLSGALKVDVGGLLGATSNRPVPTLSAPSRGINLKPFLDRADGGTGAQLTGANVAATQTAKPLPGKRLRRLFR
jgi:hypothetical protein